METKQIFKDSYGNRVFKTFISSRKIYQYCVKNKYGKLVNPRDTIVVLKIAGVLFKPGITLKSGINFKIPIKRGLNPSPLFFNNNCKGVKVKNEF